MAKKKRYGIVTSCKTKKTIIIATTTRYQHPKYKKIVLRTKNFMVHDENNQCKLGDFIIIEECAPVSKKKAWILKKII